MTVVGRRGGGGLLDGWPWDESTSWRVVLRRRRRRVGGDGVCVLPLKLFLPLALVMQKPGGGGGARGWRGQGTGVCCTEGPKNALPWEQSLHQQAATAASSTSSGRVLGCRRPVVMPAGTSVYSTSVLDCSDPVRGSVPVCEDPPPSS